jgi:hypothetical protein
MSESYSSCKAHQDKLIKILKPLQKAWDSAHIAYCAHPSAPYRSDQDADDISIWMACCEFIAASDGLTMTKNECHEVADWLLKCGCDLLNAAECCVYFIDRRALFQEIGKAIELEPMPELMDKKVLIDEFYDIFQPHDTEKE